tara:strand:+ start:132 stop:398 length:267 start_codon:yes stop_codon:yes gene_type:complete
VVVIHLQLFLLQRRQEVLVVQEEERLIHPLVKQVPVIHLQLVLLKVIMVEQEHLDLNMVREVVEEQLQQVQMELLRQVEMVEQEQQHQ